MSVSPSGDHFLFIDQPHEYGRAHRDPAPIQDPLIQLGCGFAYGPLRAQVWDRRRQPFDLLAQL
jgi:hypothetical protein